MDLALEKSRFLVKIQIFFLKLPIESVCPKKSSKTRFGPPKGPATRKYPKKDEVRVSLKQKNSLSRRYFHLKMIAKGLLRHPQIPRDINK